MATLLQHLDHLVLVLWEDFCETVGALDKVVLGRSGEATVDQLLRIVNLGAEGKHLAGLLSDGDGVTSKHFNRNTELLGFDDGLSGILTRGVEHGKHAQEDPWLTVLLVGDTKRAESTTSKFCSLVPEQIGRLFRALGEVKHSLWCTLGAGKAVTTKCAHCRNTLGHWIERSEFLGLPVILQDVTSLRISLEGEDSHLVDRIERLDVVRGGESGAGHHPVDILALSDIWLSD